MIYVTLTPSFNYHDTKIFFVGQVLKLVKEPDNIYDYEAIRVECAGIGKIGYVANSVNTVVKGTYSAGRLYDKMDNESYCRILFITKSEAIGEVIENPNDEIGQEFRRSEDYVRRIINYFEKTDFHLSKSEIGYKLEESPYKEEEIS
ncbi:HIRAN domain-containing protein [bacterium]|nr:HIRAN domain-containing protein [bacterium]